MVKPQTSDLLIIAGTVTAVAALGFLAGFIFGHPPKTKLAVNTAGNLERRIAED